MLLMTTKRQIRSEILKEKKLKKSTRLFYLALILGGIFVVLVIFFVTLFSALFPPVDMETINKKDKYLANLYFSDQQERFLKTERRYIYKEDNPSAQAKEVVKALLEGSKMGLVNTFPAEVVVRDVRVDASGVAWVDFDKNLIRLHPGSFTSEMATIYSLTNSLTKNIPQIKKIKILIDGKEIPSLKGHISTANAFAPDWELIVSEN
jgi:hypothetical protein